MNERIMRAIRGLRSAETAEHADAFEDLLRIEVERAEAEVERLRGALREFYELTIKEHPHAKLLRKDIESGRVEKLMSRVGAEVFDPTGKVRLLLRARRALAGEEPK